MGEQGDVPLSEALDRLSEEERDQPTVEALLADLGGASFGFSLLGPALIVVSPLSGIPGLSSLCGITIAIVAAQMVFGRRVIWLPAFIRNRAISRERLGKAIGWLRPPLRWLDHVTRPRLEWLLRPPFVLPLQATSLLCGAAMPLLELVPLTSSLLGLAVSLFAVAIVTRDGLVALLGLGVIGGAGIAAFRFLSA